MSYDTTQPSLLSRVRDHADHAAWREFDKKYRDLILGYCRRRGVQASDAEDVRQMVMMSLAKQLRTFQYSPERGRFRGYLGMAVANAIHRLHRRPNPVHQGLDTNVASGIPSEDDVRLDAEWESEWMDHHYRTAMETVRKSADEKSVRVFEQLLAGDTTDAVAESFGMSRDAVHKVKQRMRDRLKGEIAAQIEEEESFGTGPAS
jgi:RNA polymerase sigma factor (sigma-70 family)